MVTSGTVSYTHLGVVVKGAFCLGACNSGVTVKIDDELITGVTSENVKEIFEKHVLKRQC